jgi:hypothetical protein
MMTVPIQLCEVCQKPIPYIRLRAVPGTKRCVKHSDVEKYYGIIVSPHKAGQYVIPVDPADPLALERAKMQQRGEPRGR